MSITDKNWQVFVGSSPIGTLIPTGTDDEWYHADFEPGDAWGNFAPWFTQAYEAFQAGDDAGWESIYAQLTMMGLSMAAEDGEVYDNPTIHIDGSSAWFVV